MSAERESTNEATSHNCAECKARELLNAAMGQVREDEGLLAQIDERLVEWRRTLAEARSLAERALRERDSETKRLKAGSR